MGEEKNNENGGENMDMNDLMSSFMGEDNSPDESMEMPGQNDGMMGMGEENDMNGGSQGEKVEIDILDIVVYFLFVSSIIFLMFLLSFLKFSVIIYMGIIYVLSFLLYKISFANTPFNLSVLGIITINALLFMFPIIIDYITIINTILFSVGYLFGSYGNIFSENVNFNLGSFSIQIPSFLKRKEETQQQTNTQPVSQNEESKENETIQIGGDMEEPEYDDELIIEGSDEEDEHNPIIDTLQEKISKGEELLYSPNVEKIYSIHYNEEVDEFGFTRPKKDKEGILEIIDNNSNSDNENDEENNDFNDNDEDLDNEKEDLNDTEEEEDDDDDDDDDFFDNNDDDDLNTEENDDFFDENNNNESLINNEEEIVVSDENDSNATEITYDNNDLDDNEEENDEEKVFNDNDNSDDENDNDKMEEDNIKISFDEEEEKNSNEESDEEKISKHINNI